MVLKLLQTEVLGREKKGKNNFQIGALL